MIVIERILVQPRKEFVTTERAGPFEELKEFLSADKPESSYAEIAARSGLKEGSVKVGVHRLRRRYGELLRAKIANTVNDPAEVEEEIRYLISILSK